MMICVWALRGRGRRMAIFLTILALVVIAASTLGLRYRGSAIFHSAAAIHLDAHPKDLPP
ncbi:hypothetical protein BD779DRAFT_1568443, partial [Infundibulicybe gibba]